ncbi:MAG: GrdX family protein [Clostridia bacterium]|nr:GrdX family protein [Clostridia bacterium]
MVYNFKIITNNELVFEKYGKEFEVDYKPGSFEELLLRVRDEVHNGAKLLTHPLTGSIKPNETPFKTVYVKKGKGATSIDYDSVVMIENAIITTRKFKIRFPVMPDNVRADFALIDLSLMESAISAVTQA